MTAGRFGAGSTSLAPGRSRGAAVQHRLRDGVDVGVLELGPRRDAAREARDLDLGIAFLQQLRDVATITSRTMPSPARAISRSIWISRGPIPSSGDRRPSSTKYSPE